jgi:hypothetical protein
MTSYRTPAVLPESLPLRRTFVESKTVAMGHPSGDIEVCPLAAKSRSIPLWVSIKVQSPFKKLPSGSPKPDSVVKERYRQAARKSEGA